MTRKPPLLPAAILGWTAVLLVSAAAAAQEPAPSDAASAEDEAAAKSIREQTIYIPYEDLRKVFEKEGRGVFLPYKKFRELWDAAREKTAPPEAEKPPVGALITEIENEATVAGDVVRVAATLKVEILGKGWQEVPLRLADAAITGATLDGQPARITSDGGGYKLLVENADGKSRQIELALTYAKAIQRTPGQNSVSFQSPQAPVSRWRVRIPESGVKVHIDPLIAATEVTGEEAAAGPAEEPPAGEEPAAEETVVLAFVGAAPTVSINWTPKAEGATGLEALATVQAEQQVTVSEGVTRTRTHLAYKISRAELAELTIEVPADQKVVNVFDANVRKWAVQPADDHQTVSVQLFEPASGSQSVTVELEQFAPEDADQRTVQVPVVRAVGVGRQYGVVVVQVAEGLRVEATTVTGLLQVDASDLPGALAGRPWAFSYRYAGVPYELTLSVEKVQPRIVADTLVQAELKPEGLLLDVFSDWTIERAAVFRLELDVPAGFEVRRVEGRGAGSTQPVAVDTHHLEGEDKTRLVVDLARKASGRVGLAVELYRELDEPDLLAPTGKTVTLPVPIPRPAPETVERSTGRVVISAPESLRVNPAATDGVRTISFQEALQSMEPVRRATPDVRPVLAFAFTDQPTGLELTAERRKPQVTIRQLLVARIEEGVVKYEATFFYEVLYSGVKSLRIDVPAAVADKLRNTTSEIREKKMDPPPDDLEKGYVAWSLAGETELLGSGRIRLVWEEKLEKLDVGSSVDVDIPRLVPRDVDRAWGQVVLVKAETIDLAAADELDGLRAIDPQQDLMPGADVPEAAAALEFHGKWSLSVTATRYKLEEVKHTSIERAVVRQVVTRAGQVSVQAVYRMRSARQRLVVRLPQKSQFDVEPKIDGRPVSLEIGQKGDYYVPLVDTESDRSFLLEFRYTLPGGPRRLDLPVFPLEPAVQRVYLCVYLPREWAPVAESGPWTDEFTWRLDDGLAWKPSPTTSDAALLSWVSDDQVTGESFPTDGQVYIFSTIRPDDPPAGSLHVRTIHQDVLTGVVLVVVIAGGLVLLPFGMRIRSMTLGVLVVAVVLCAVFLPMLAYQILDGTLAAAVAVVVIVWLVAYLAWTLPRRRPHPAPPAADTAAEPPPEPEPSGVRGAEKVEDEEPPTADAVEEPPAGESPGGQTGESPGDASEADQPKSPGDEGGKTNA